MVRKVPISIYSDNMPAVSIELDQHSENKAALIIKQVKDIVDPLVAGSIGLYGIGTPSLFTGFLGSVIDQVGEGKYVNASVGFDVFSRERQSIMPAAYSVVVLKPEGMTVDGSGFYLNEENGKLYLFDKGDKKYDQYPYFIIEMGVSNYLEIQELPSGYFNSHKTCGIEAEEVEKMETNLVGSKDKLTGHQYAAEELLLSYYKTLSAVSEGIKEEPNSNRNAAVLVEAYNSFFDYKTTMSYDNLEKGLLEEHFKPGFKHLSECIDNNIKVLDHFSEVNRILPVFNDYDTNRNEHDLLIEMHSFIEATEGIDYLKQSKFYNSIGRRIISTEIALYNRHFSRHVEDILKFSAYDPKVKLVYDKMVSASNKYPHCRKCIEEKDKALTHYNTLVNSNQDYREKIADYVKMTEEFTLTSAKLKEAINMEISQPGRSIIANDEMNEVLLKVNSYEATLVEAKDKLYKTLTLTTISPADKKNITKVMDDLDKVFIGLDELKKSGPLGPAPGSSPAGG